MKFSLNWVGKFVDLSDKNIDEIKQAVWSRLAEVEDVKDLNEIYGNLKVAKVVEKRKHPNSNKLFIAQVNIGNKVVQVVAGAGNFEVGDFVPYTPVGVKVPVNAYPEKFDGVVRAIKLAGEISYGMLNSEYELGLGEDHSGILILKPEELPGSTLKPGQSLAEALGLDDVIIEIENKSLTHRGDVFSVFGVARELAVIFDRKLTIPEEFLSEEIKIDAKKYKVEIYNKENKASPRYSAIVLGDVKIKSSPLWLKVVLAKHDIKSINNVVDITNYILLMYGQPLHAFDFNKAFGKTTKAEVFIRYAKEGENILALDGKEHKLDKDILVIANKKQPIAIAGIIGGAESAIDNNTTTVFLESANFNQYVIRRGSMKLGIFTDAATVYARAQDPNKTLRAAAYAVKLMQKYADAKVYSDVADNYPKVRKGPKVYLNLGKVRDFLGVDISDTQIQKILSGLEIKIKNKKGSDTKELEIPSFRFDLNIPEDIYEEIIRIYGYEKLELVSPLRDVKPVALNTNLRLQNIIKEKLSELGMFEMVNFEFISNKLYKKLNIPLNSAFKIINAVSKEVEYIRTLVTPSLLLNIEYNSKFFDEVLAYELGKTFRKNMVYGNVDEANVYVPPRRFGKDEDDLPAEDRHLAAAIMLETPDPIYYVGKYYLDKLLERLHISVEYKHISELDDDLRQSLPAYISDLIKIYKPGRTALLLADNVVIGILGELSSIVLNQFGFTKPIVAFELQYHLLSKMADISLRFKQPSKYPYVWQDLCFVVNKNTKYSELISAILEVNYQMEKKGYEPLIRNIEPVDIYQPEDDKVFKQITVRIILQSYLKTLKDKDIDAWRKKIITNVEKRIGASLKE